MRTNSIRILIVEDSPTDMELFRYLLETKFQSEAKFREAGSLEAALNYLGRGDIDCVILDLTLPDSSGRDTFLTIHEKYPNIPIIVMTHSKDRDLAIEMIEEGAADFILKSYTNEDEVFQRIIFAIVKHQQTIRVSPTNVNSLKKMEKSNQTMMTAHQSGQHAISRDMAVETTNALTDISKKLFAEVQQVSNRMTASQSQLEHLTKTVDGLDRELLRGHSMRPSMRSQVEIITHRLDESESDISGIKEAVKKQEEFRRQEDLQIRQAKMSDRTKIWLGMIALIGTIITATVTYYAAMSKAKEKHEDLKSTGVVSP